MKKLLLLTLTLFHFQVNAQSLDADRVALVKFYNATNGPQWTTNTNWNLNTSPCGWYGVTCENGRVTQLFLVGNNISGTIPIEKEELGELKVLNLSVNNLTGTIPAELGSLSNLEHVNLSSNKLTGNIPPQLYNLVKLKALELGFNQLTGTIPEPIGNLYQIENLSLQGNQLSGKIPESILHLPQLETLALYNNQLSGVIPNTFESFSNLTFLTLHENRFTGEIPASLGKLPKLRRLFLSDNLLTGSIPDSLSHLQSLVQLYLYGNRLTGNIPSTLANMTSLEELQLGKNNLTGPIPTSFGSFDRLRRLHLHENLLSGNIPEELGNLTYLNQLELFNNNLTGSIPNSISNLRFLTHLLVQYNQLNGPLPDLSNLPDNGVVYISYNNFTFDGIESNLSKLDEYSPQYNIPLNLNDKTLSVNAGGILSNNSYRWFKNGIQVALNKGINYLTTNGNGDYFVQVTNDLASDLVLYSNSYLLNEIPLPVTLVNFIAKKAEIGNLVQWSTTSETNNAGFELERSSDAKSFDLIAKLDGKGNTKNANSYQFTDMSPFTESYYRLKQIDFDGTSTYSRTIHVQMERTPLKVYPNPAKSDFVLESAATDDPAEIYNLQGQKLIQKPGANLQIFNTDQMASGTYIIKVGTQSVKLVLEK